jgi:hypothetical protein
MDLLSRLSELECSLDAEGSTARENRLSALAARATEQKQSPRGLVLRFPPDPALAAEAAEIAALEAQCCGAAFTVEIGRDDLVLVLHH